MPSSLFPQRSNPLSQMAQLKQAIESIRNGNADMIAEQMQRSNPMFAKFVSENRNKSTEQILNENGLKVDDIKNILNMLR